MTSSEQPSVLIVGAGPVGLFLAILLKGRNSKANVVVHEKRASFRRDRVLLLQPDILKALPAAVQRALLGRGENGGACYVKRPNIDPSGNCYLSPVDKGQASVTTRSLEEALHEYALSQGVVVKRGDQYAGTNASLDTWSRQFDVIIGADGSNSAVRKWAGIKWEQDTSLPEMYGLLGTFDSSEAITPKRFKREDSALNVGGIQGGLVASIPQHRYRGFRSRKHPFYVAVQLTKSEAEASVSATNMSGLSDSLQKNLEKSAHFFGMKLPKDRSAVNTDVFPIEIFSSSDIYAAKQKKAGGRRSVLLVGDASETVHFFSGTGVNKGMRQAQVVSNILDISTRRPDSAAAAAADEIVSERGIDRYRKFWQKQVAATQRETKEIMYPERTMQLCSAYSESTIRHALLNAGYNPSGQDKEDQCLLLSRALHLDQVDDLANQVTETRGTFRDKAVFVGPRDGRFIHRTATASSKRRPSSKGRRYIGGTTSSAKIYPLGRKSRKASSSKKKKKKKKKKTRKKKTTGKRASGKGRYEGRTMQQLRAVAERKSLGSYKGLRKKDLIRRLRRK